MTAIEFFFENSPPYSGKFSMYTELWPGSNIDYGKTIRNIWNRINQENVNSK